MFKARTTYQIVEPADMELAETAIKDAFAKCVQHGATRVIVALESVKIYTVTRKGLNQIKTKELICLSLQKFVNCYMSENYGCNGGLMDYAFEYIKKNGSITTEKSYPYVAKQRSCDNSLEESQVVTVDGYQDVPRNNENALLKAVANQPVSVAIEASGYDFQFYYELFVARSMWLRRVRCDLVSWCLNRIFRSCGYGLRAQSGKLNWCEWSASFMCTVRGIWKRRNDRIFNGKHVPPDILASRTV